MSQSSPATFLEPLQYNFLLKMTIRQNIWRMHRRHLSWNSYCFLSMVVEVFQHSEPYRRTPRTLILKILTIVWVLRPVDLQTVLSIEKVWLALVIRVLISWSQSLSVVILLPKYTNSITSSNGLPLWPYCWLRRSYIIPASSCRWPWDLCCWLYHQDTLMSWYLLDSSPRSSA